MYIESYVMSLHSQGYEIKKIAIKNSSDIATLQNYNGTIMKTFISHRSDHYRVINVLSLAINH